MSSSQLRPRIYVASLSDYVAGRLHGKWIDAVQPPTAILSEIHQMLARSPEPIAEEWAIHDYDDFSPIVLGEYETIETVAELAAGIADFGEAFAHWAAYLGPSDYEHLDNFKDAYRGHWDSTVAYAEDLVEAFGFDPEDFAPEYLAPYVSFDLGSFARDLEMDLYVAEASDGGVHVFDS